MHTTPAPATKHPPTKWEAIKGKTSAFSKKDAVELFSTEFNFHVFSPKVNKAPAFVFLPRCIRHSSSHIPNPGCKTLGPGNLKNNRKHNIPSPPKKSMPSPTNSKKTKLQQATKFKGFFKNPPWTTWKNSQPPPIPQLQGTRIEDCLEYQGQGWRSNGQNLWWLLGGPMATTPVSDANDLKYSNILLWQRWGRVKRIKNFLADDLKYNYLRITRATSNDLCDLQWRKSSPLKKSMKKIFKIIPDQKRGCRNGWIRYIILNWNLSGSLFQLLYFLSQAEIESRWIPLWWT